MNEELHGHSTEILLSKCLNCGNPFLKEHDYQIIDGNSYLTNETQFFPDREKPFAKNCPKIVINPYQEAIKCYRANAYDACAIMCRKGIEAICIDKGEKKGKLVSRLENLNSKGILENTLFDWANELRLIGNDGAHSHDLSVGQEDAKDSLDFFEALITYLYHLVNQYQELKKRRNK
ncbi:DUF4145 domain-containing protein [Croceitalea sp. MTPC5]|uniref:DUF4145 domain-containing protein n=1 Tax=Croceitalea sp. MTPC5 TaxID=3056565 RepID=UPI0030CE24E5